MAIDNKLYTKDSIESLSPLEFTRLRPQVYCGDTTYSTQLLVEIISNAVDEFNLGHGNLIYVQIDDDEIVVQDSGQGFIPNSFRDDGKTILEAAFSVLNTSGKYRDDGAYEGTSLGSFGIGSKITTFLSNWLNVTTTRDGLQESVCFKEGVFESREVGKIPDKNLSGTVVNWKPSKEFFTHTEVDINVIKQLFDTITCLCPGLTIVLNHNGNKQEYKSDNGLQDYVEKHLGDDEILNNRMNMQYANDKNKLDLILTYSSKYASTIIPYVNTGLTDSGPHITAFKTAITREFNKFFRDKGWLKEKDANLTGDDIQEGLYLVFNITTSGVKYDAQVKSRVTGIEMSDFSKEFSEQLQYWLASNEKEIKGLADKALNARKAREAAKRARDAVRNTGEKTKSKLLNLPTKLVDSWNKKREECELFIAEGDSAAASLIAARDGKNQAVFPIRGKILNVYKASVDKIYANQEIINLIKALGLDLDKKTGKMAYDTNKLRYGKIMLACDADSDGKAIKNLLLTCLWYLCPDLIKNGHVYATVPPLFRITNKKNEYIYLKDENALAEYKNQHSGEKYLVNRAKGLGEQDPEELEACLLTPSTRNVQQITVEDAKSANNLFEIFMGTAVVPRREYILAHSEEGEL